MNGIEWVVEAFGCSSQALRDTAALQNLIHPAVGSIFSEERRRISRLHDRVFFANSDLSGISIFEEAQYHGVEAAQRVLAELNGRT